MDNKTKLLGILLDFTVDNDKKFIGLNHQSTLFVYENDEPIGFNQSVLSRIRKDGGLKLEIWAAKNFKKLFNK